MKESTKETRRKILEEHRKGERILHIPFASGEMMFLKDCPICKEVSKWTSIGRFVCKPCRYIFD